MQPSAPSWIYISASIQRYDWAHFKSNEHRSWCLWVATVIQICHSCVTRHGKAIPGKEDGISLSIDLSLEKQVLLTAVLQPFTANKVLNCPADARAERKRHGRHSIKHQHHSLPAAVRKKIKNKIDHSPRVVETSMRHQNQGSVRAQSQFSPISPVHSLLNNTLVTEGVWVGWTSGSQHGYGAEGWGAGNPCQPLTAWADCLLTL